MSSLPPTPATFGRFWVALLIVAALAAGFAIVFRFALALSVSAFGGAHDIVSAMRGLAPVWRVILPCCGGLCAGLLGLWLAKIGASQGVGDVMEAVVLGRVRLSTRVTLLKSLASFCAIASGASLGREGPLIQFGGAIGQLTAARFALSASYARRLIAAGAAAGFAAAYNTPFAAVLFVLEVVTGVVVLDAILPVLVATTIATALTRAAVGEGPIYGQRVFQLQSSLELLAFAGLGLIAALVAQAFMRLLAGAEAMFRRSRIGLPWRPALGGLIAGLALLALPEIAGNGYEPLSQLLDAEFLPGFVALLLVGKILATTATVSAGNPGGVFTPTLLIGGATGFLYADLLGRVAQLGPHGGYALVGMAAATAATTHAPLMAAVMAFELSGDYAIALPLLLATALATIVSRRLRRDSIYAAELRRRGVAWELTLEGRRLAP
jgi:CIC family chloride channel protein